MAQNRSFKDYVADHFYNELSTGISDFLDENYSDLHITSQRVRTIDNAELSDIEVKCVYVDNQPGMKISFDVLLEAQFEIYENDRHNDREDDKYQWFKVSCSGDLSCNLDDFSISAVEEYSYRDKKQNPMDDALVPVIKKEELETVATDFLNHYYREALYEPMPVDTKILTRRMGLAIELKRITSDFSVFGQIFFTDCDTQYYNEEGVRKTIHVSKGTVLVDPDSYYLRNLGSVNNTIVHECVHWDKHRKAFELERLYNENATQIKCQVVGGIKDSKARTATDWMEWQANALAPRIQMPYTQFKEKAEEFIREYKQILETDETVDVMEPVIDGLAAFFVVSRCAAKIRMVDVGYEEAIGAFTYIDGHYVRAHGFKKGSIRHNQTFTISTRDAVFESFMDQELHQATKQGNFLFVENHFCINDPKYIESSENGRPILTEYALHHIDECCLAFNLSIKSSTNNYGKQFYTECVLFRDASSDIIFEASFVDSDQNKTIEQRAKTVQEYNREIIRITSSLPNDFCDALTALMAWREVTVERLAEIVRMDDRSIRRLKNEPEHNATKETVIALCIGLQLPPPLGEMLLEKAGYKLKNNEADAMYDFLLRSCYSYSLDECNLYLTQVKMKPLGGKE